MPLFTASRIDQAFKRFMKHHVSPAGSVGAERCPPDTSTQISIQMLQKPNVSKKPWTQKKKRKEEPL